MVQIFAFAEPVMVMYLVWEMKLGMLIDDIWDREQCGPQQSVGGSNIEQKGTYLR